jgi:hypothetical protein
VPRSVGVSSSGNSPQRRRRPKQDGSPSPTSIGSAKRSDQSVKLDLIRVFAEEWKNYYGTSYIPSDLDGKAVYYNVVPLVDTNGGYEDFLEEWTASIRYALESDITWGNEDTDEAGRLTISGFVNNYNDIRLSFASDEGAMMFRAAYNKYRQIWGIDKMAAYRSATKVIHSEGYRLSSIDPRLLKSLKSRYSNRDLGLDMCPEEDRLRFTDKEIEAEIDGNQKLFEFLVGRSSGEGALRRRLIEAYKIAQSEGVIWDVK